MKNVLFLLLWLPVALSAQSRLIDKEGEAMFFSDALIEDITAKTKSAMAVIDTSTDEVAVSLNMKSFKFRKSLMQEHFNENYVESDKYPKATFTGKLTKSPDYSKNGKQEIPIKGEMTIHGVTKSMETTVTFTISDKKIDAETVFNLKVADYDIKIPTLMFKKIAEVVEITAKFSFDR